MRLSAISLAVSPVTRGYDSNDKDGFLLFDFYSLPSTYEICMWYSMYFFGQTPRRQCCSKPELPPNPPPPYNSQPETRKGGGESQQQRQGAHKNANRRWTYAHALIALRQEPPAETPLLCFSCHSPTPIPNHTPTSIRGLTPEARLLEKKNNTDLTPSKRNKV